MKLFKKSLLLLTFSFGAFFTSCEKDETAENINDQEALVDEIALESFTTSNQTVDDYRMLGDGKPNAEWLNAQEGDKLGHTIEKHWTKSDQFLSKRSDSEFATSFQINTSEGFERQSVVINQIRSAANTAVKTAIEAGVNWKTVKWKGSGFILGDGYNARGRYRSNLRNMTITVAYSVSLAAWYVVTAYPNFS